jgi:GT2 family glycosyltransferase
MMAAAPKVFILILHWQKYEVTRNCLASFRTLEYSHYQIIVLDNASTNDSAHRLEKEFPECLFIFNAENNGYGAGMNPGIRYALAHGGEYIFLLNNDVIVYQPEFLRLLVRFMESHPQVGIAGPKLLFADGRYQKSDNRFFLAMALIIWWPSILTRIAQNRGWIRSRENETFRVRWLNAVALLFKRQVFEDIGLMDERFFLGAEDIDLSLRAQQKGWETWYYPKAKLTHLSFTSHENTGIAYDEFYAKTMVQFLYKHYRQPIATSLQLLTALGFFIRGVEWSIIALVKRNRIKTARDFFALSKKIIEPF